MRCSGTAGRRIRPAIADEISISRTHRPNQIGLAILTMSSVPPPPGTLIYLICTMFPPLGDPYLSYPGCMSAKAAGVIRRVDPEDPNAYNALSPVTKNCALAFWAVAKIQSSSGGVATPVTNLMIGCSTAVRLRSVRKRFVRSEPRGKIGFREGALDFIQ